MTEINKSLKASRMKTLDMVYIALCAVLIAICSWITIPSVIPFTLQTFGIFCTVGLLGGKRGTIAVFVYILLGALGLPVFHGFTGGLGIILSTTGGYIIGFLFLALIYWLITKFLGNKTMIMIAAMIAGLLVCYAIGSIWFMMVYAKSSGPVGLLTVLGWCVFPFIIPDLIKLALAMILVKRVAPHVK